MSEELIKEYSIQGTTESGLDIECAWNIGKAMADWLQTAGNVVVVYDAAQQQLATAIMEGVRLQGRNVVDGGVGDAALAVRHISALGLSGAAVVGFDPSTAMISIEIYQETGVRIESETGLSDIRALVEAGNFVPAATKGELTAIA
jgi:phosphomannomutase